MTQQDQGGEKRAGSAERAASASNERECDGEDGQGRGKTRGPFRTEPREFERSSCDPVYQRWLAKIGLAPNVRDEIVAGLQHGHGGVEAAAPLSPHFATTPSPRLHR